MFNIIKTEWLKVNKYPAFWLVIGLTALSYPGINYIFHKMFSDITQRKDQAGQIASAVLGNPFSLPEIWRTAAFASSLFVFIPAILVIMIISNEYTYKTNRQNIIDGWSRGSFMTGKLLGVLMITLIVTFLYALVSLIIGLSNSTATDPQTDKWKLSYYIILFALQTFSQLSLAFLVGFLVRKAFIALSIFIFYFLILENIAVGLLYKYANDIGRFLPLEISDRIIPRPVFMRKFDEKAYQATLDAVKYHVVYTLILIALTWLLCFRINKRRDL
jgi:ABC-type transport system involved in multi-copper enzyme maturation permease subunit